MSLTHVYFLALHNSLSDVFSTRDKASNGPGYTILLQDARNNLGHRNRAQRSAVRRFPNSRIARCHRDCEIPTIYSNGEVKRGQDAEDAEGIRNWTE